LRDAVRKDIEQAAGALAFATTLHERLEAQRRLFADFPRVMEQLRSGALERVAVALSRLFDGKEQFDLPRFLRDLPLALGQLAAAEARRSAPPPPASPRNGSGVGPAAAVEVAGAADGSGAPSAPAAGAPAPQPSANDAVDASGGSDGATVAAAGDAPASNPDPSPAAESEGGMPAPVPGTDVSGSAPPAASQGAAASSGSTGAAIAASSPPPAHGPPSSASGAGGGSAAPPTHEPPSPRLELRSRLLAAAPQLQKAVVTYRRSVATVRRAAAPRRAPGPWRSDREVLEEAQRAVDFARQMFDAYADAWADQPVQPGIGGAVAAEADRFLAWTQLARYVELAGPHGATQASPGAGVTPSSEPPPHAEEHVDRPSSQGGGESEARSDAGA
jgi:hypothetical protein